MTSIESSLKNSFNKPTKRKTLANKVTEKASKTINNSGTKTVALEINIQGTELLRESNDTTNSPPISLANVPTNAIVEIESSGSSTVSEDFPQLEEQQQERNVCIIDNPNNFFELDIISVEESEESDYTKQNKLENELDVLYMFEDIEELDELSLAPTDDFIVKLPITIEIAPTDVGTFVNPLTGVKSSCLTLNRKSKIDNDYFSTGESDKEYKQDDGYKSNTSDDEDVFEKDIVESADVLEDVNDRVDDDDRIVQQFLEEEKELEAAVALDKYKLANAFIREEELRQIQQHTLEFLYKLIDQCVAKSMYLDSDMILRKSLDKRKLINELIALYELLDKEERVLEARDKFKKAEQQCNEEVYHLEQLVKNTFRLKSRDKLQKFVINALSEMAAIRNEISNDRLRLLLKQHQVSMLQEQKKNLEDVGNGLNITQYEAMETETNVLIKRLEERNSVHKGLYTRFNFDFHNMAHFQGKLKMVRQTISVKKQFLDDLIQEKNRFRTFLFQLEVKRKQLTSEIRNLSFQSGLLDKPVLMKDYDETVEKANKLRQTIEDLKCTIAGLNTKISALNEI